MRSILIGMMVFSALAAVAGTKGYDLRMDLTIDGKFKSSPSVLLKEGETATIFRKIDVDENFIEVVATEGKSKNGILMKFVVGKIGEDGERIILARPEILAKENQPASITLGGNEGGSEKMSLSVIATKETL